MFGAKARLDRHRKETGTSDACPASSLPLFDIVQDLVLEPFHTAAVCLERIKQGLDGTRSGGGSVGSRCSCSTTECVPPAQTKCLPSGRIVANPQATGLPSFVVAGSSLVQMKLC